MSKQQEIINIDLSHVLKEYYTQFIPKYFRKDSTNSLLKYLNDLGSLHYKHFYGFSDSIIKLNKEIFDKPGFKSNYLKLDKDDQYYLGTVVASIPVKFVKELKDNRLGEFIVYSD